MANHIESSLLDALAARQKTDPANLHELDSADVAISHEALSAIGKAARSLLSAALGTAGAGDMPVGEIVKLFASKLYWNEAGGELIMCAAIAGRTVCLPVPAGHWNVPVRGSVQ